MHERSLHHLSDAQKGNVLRGAHLALRRGGHLHIADWGAPLGMLLKASFDLLRLLDGWSNTRVHATGRLREPLAQAGFSSSSLSGRLPTALGTLELLNAQASASSGLAATGTLERMGGSPPIRPRTPQ